MKKAAAILLSIGLLIGTSSFVLAEESGTSGRTKSRLFASASPRGEKVSCESRMDAVKKRSEQLTERAQKMEDTFGKIAKRVEDYYNDKVVPGGVTVPNYDALVTDIATKKAAVDTAIADAQAKAAAFSCEDATTARSQVQAFKLSMQEVIRALKAYKTSVRNLIVAVKSAGGRLQSPKPSSSPGV